MPVPPLRWRGRLAAADLPDQSLGIGRGLDLIGLLDPRGKALVGLDRSRAIPAAFEQTQQAAEGALIKRCQRSQSLGPGRGLGDVPLFLGAVDQGLDRPGRAVPESHALEIEPAFEFRRLGYVEPFQQVPAVAVHRPGEISGRQRRLELGYVGGKSRFHDGQLFIAPADDHLVAQGLAQEVDRPAERRPGMTLVQLRPEHAEQGVTPVKAAGSGNGEVSQQRQSLGLFEHGADLFAVLP
jgi:hypothetical protein